MWVRRLAAAAAFLTLVLIVAGGLVTNTDSGLACPDWPTCFGSPMPRMVGGVLVEHTHRLIATAVGLCTLALCVGTLPRRLWLLRCGAFAASLGDGRADLFPDRAGRRHPPYRRGARLHRPAVLPRRLVADRRAPFGPPAHAPPRRRLRGPRARLVERGAPRARRDG